MTTHLPSEGLQPFGQPARFVREEKIVYTTIMDDQQRRIVIKIGTSVLTANSVSLNRDIMRQVVAQILTLREAGWGVVLVTSGAVAAGREMVKAPASSDQTVRRQVFAAIGQARLMHEYELLFQEHGVHVGQALLTRDDFIDRRRYENALHTLTGLLKLGAVPILNENDVVSVHELSFGDNDILAANTAVALEASTLLLLTNQAGLMTRDPKRHQDATRIPFVEDVEATLLDLCTNSTSELGAGGMLSKVKAAQLATSAGVDVWIANGLRPENIAAIIAGDDLGTKFLAKKRTLTSRERWILCAKHSNAAIVIDRGAAAALKKRKSLLMVGVRRIVGSFDARDIVEVLNEQDETIAFGVVDYGASTLNQALADPKRIEREVIHANNLRTV